MTDSSKARAQSAWEKHTNAIAAMSSPLPRCVVPCVALVGWKREALFAGKEGGKGGGVG